MHASFKSAEAAMSVYSFVLSVASAAVAVPGGVLADAVGRLPVLAGCWVVTGIGCVGFAFATDFQVRGRLIIV